MALEPIVVGYRYSREKWIIKHGTASGTGIDQYDTKREAVDAARKRMKDDGMPAMIVLDKDWNTQYITLNSDALKDPMWWKRVDLFSI